MRRVDDDLACRIQAMRIKVEREVTRLLDDHMAEHYPTESKFWSHAMRCSIEVASWPEWMRKRCYSQD